MRVGKSSSTKRAATAPALKALTSMPCDKNSTPHESRHALMGVVASRVSVAILSSAPHQARQQRPVITKFRRPLVRNSGRMSSAAHGIWATVYVGGSSARRVAMPSEKRDPCDPRKLLQVLLAPSWIACGVVTLRTHGQGFSQRLACGHLWSAHRHVPISDLT